jgi:heparan-alpha-glucosaminide N-acetyltransferase
VLPRERKRVVALDVTRGLFVAGMLIVEQLPGDAATTWPWLRHAQWTGWTGADLVFPGFLFVAGTTMAITLRKGWTTGTGVRLLRRTLVLLAAGLVFNAYGHGGEPLRLPGVLQRIAVAGLAAALIILASRRTWWIVAVAIVGLLAAEHQALTLVSLDCGRGVITPECNVAGAVDESVFGAEHLYHQGTLGHDPEGLLGTLGATATVLLGWLAGLLVLRRHTAALAALAVGLWGAALLWPDMLTGKRLWTPPFVFRTAAISAGVLVVADVLFDRLGRQRAARTVTTIAAYPWVVLGRNALVVYVGQHMLGNAVAQHLVFTPDHALMAHALVVLGVWVLVAAALDALDIHVSP